MRVHSSYYEGRKPSYTCRFALETAMLRFALETAMLRFALETAMLRFAFETAMLRFALPIDCLGVHS